MDLFWTIYIFIVGLVFGSFFNVAGLRLAEKGSLVSPPSHCPACRTRLSAYDLVPVASFLAHKGRCGYCGVRISLLYPLGELASGLLFVWMYRLHGLMLETLVGFGLVGLSVIVTVSDLKYRLIPNRAVAFFVAYVAVLRLIRHPDPLWVYAAGLAVGGGVLLAVALISRGGMGMGDVKLLAVCGLALGVRDVLIALFAASLLGSVVGACLMASGIIKRKQAIPFGPFLAVGVLLAYGYGEGWAEWYTSFIG